MIKLYGHVDAVKIMLFLFTLLTSWRQCIIVQKWNKRFKPFKSKNEKHKVSNLHLHNMLNLSMLGTVNIGQ